MPKTQVGAQIARMLEIAAANPGQYQTFRTINNLKIDVMLMNEMTYLQISRTRLYPTLQDWANVTRHWPYTINILPEKRQSFGRFYLVASWLPASRRTPVLIVPKDH